MRIQTKLTDPRDLENLYNVLMWDIEPELTTEILPDLDFIYRNETQEERQLRYEWYAIAYEQFLEKFRDFIVKGKDYLKGVNRDTLKLGEAAEMENEQSGISSLEQSLQDS